LYFPGFAARRLLNAPPWCGAALLPTDERHLTVSIAVSAEDRQAARAALSCHRSQFTSEEIEELTRLADHLMGDTVFLRPWLGTTAPVTDLFEDPQAVGLRR
jgi:hypothetical protein